MSETITFQEMGKKKNPFFAGEKIIKDAKPVDLQTHVMHCDLVDQLFCIAVTPKIEHQSKVKYGYAMFLPDSDIVLLSSVVSHDKTFTRNIMSSSHWQGAT